MRNRGIAWARGGPAINRLAPFLIAAPPPAHAPIDARYNPRMDGNPYKAPEGTDDPIVWGRGAALLRELALPLGTIILLAIVGLLFGLFAEGYLAWPDYSRPTSEQMPAALPEK